MHFIRPIILCFGLSVTLVSAQSDLEKLPPSVNTDQYDETTPVLNKKGDKLYFTRTGDPDFIRTLIGGDDQMASAMDDGRYMAQLEKIYSQIAGKEIPNPAASVYNQDIWIVPILDDTVREAYHPGYPLNNALPNSLVSTGMEPDEYVVLNQFYEDGSMYGGFSRIHIGDDGSYHFPAPMHIYEFDVTNSDVDMTMTPDGHVLILSMQRSDGKGLNDLYVSFFIRKNVWSAPIQMGGVLNTPFQESSPNISPDKRYLYFSSNRPGSIGGSDIYVSERLDYTWLKWSEPIQVKGSVNSPFDESQPYFDAAANYMYFTSKRDGSSDIFRQRLTPRPRLKKPLYVRGRILDSSTGQPVHSELFWGQHSSKDYLEYFNTYTGEFFVTMTEYEPYKFMPRQSNQQGQRILVDPRGMEKQGIDTLDLVLYLDPRDGSAFVSAQDTNAAFMRTHVPASTEENQLNEDLSFYNINFVKGKAIILAKSKQALHYLLDLMNNHPGLQILIEGHTDNVGDEIALMDLSLMRAQSIRDYLVERGIPSDRMQVAGLGPSKPLTQNTLESGREKNRRVEISVLKVVE
jgi:outer membrane protein OmpA-like peptidoglycan-associated protein